VFYPPKHELVNNPGPPFDNASIEGEPTSTARASLRIETPSETRVDGYFLIKTPSQDRWFQDDIAFSASNPFVRHDRFPIPSTGGQKDLVESEIEREGEFVALEDQSASFNQSNDQQVLVITVTPPGDVAVAVETL
jgi:hypothetical protein